MSGPDTKPAGECCPTCGAVFATGAWCARCALGEVLAEDARENDGQKADVLFLIAGHAVLAELGRGAAGIVYRARQEHPAREVALKILRPHEAGSAESRARFRMEATTVAGLDHPAILPVLSVGEHDGLPYFTMKLCAGGSLAQRTEPYRGKWKEIAALVATLSDAVHHAHQRGVLHRDLKPGNILFDEADRPFVSDFGIAKNSRDTESGAPVTQPMAVMGTRGYLAPEVLSKGAAAATLAADVYGLGAILFELLNGAPPEENAGVTLSRGVPRDLAVITTKCLQLEPTARYASAAALAEDLRAWLAGRPIAARPVSALGQAWAWARRNPALASVSAAALLALLAVAGVASVAAVRLSREQRATAAALKKAETEAAISKSIADFLQNDLLAQASPDQQPDRNLSLRTVLDRAAKKIDGRFPGQPLVEASIRETLSDTYGALGDYVSKQQYLEKTVAIRREKLGEDHPQTLRAMGHLAEDLREQGQYPAAETLATRTLASQRRVLGKEDPATLETMSTLGLVLSQEGKAAEAEAFETQLLEITQRQAAKEPRNAASRENLAARYSAMENLAIVYRMRGSMPEAETLLVRTLESSRRDLGPDHPQTLDVMNILADLYMLMNKNALAEPLALETIERRTRVLGPDHHNTFLAQQTLAAIYQNQGKFSEAEEIHLRVIEVMKRTKGPEYVDTLRAMNTLVVNYQLSGKLAEAKTILLQLQESAPRVFGPENPNTLDFLSNLGLNYWLEGDLKTAEDIDVRLLETKRRVLGSDHIRTLLTVGNLATVYRDEGKNAEAEKLLVERVETSLRVFGDSNLGTFRALDKLGGFYLQQNRFAEAEPRLRAALDGRVKLSEQAWLTASTRSQLGAALAGLKRFEEAEPLLLESYATLKSLDKKIPFMGKQELPAAGERLVRCYLDWGKPNESETWRRQLAEAGKSP